ncbi:hypothetical protein HDV57DRAFT_494677 [Trichoderma longibrachiatum]
MQWLTGSTSIAIAVVLGNYAHFTESSPEQLMWRVSRYRALVSLARALRPLNKVQIHSRTHSRDSKTCIPLRLCDSSSNASKAGIAMRDLRREASASTTLYTTCTCMPFAVAYSHVHARQAPPRSSMPALQPTGTTARLRDTICPHYCCMYQAWISPRQVPRGPTTAFAGAASTRQRTAPDAPPNHHVTAPAATTTTLC